jgi:hypothetical protein
MMLRQSARLAPRSAVALTQGEGEYALLSTACCWARLPLMGKLQHFVGRFYLRAWAEGERLYCLQDHKVRRDNIRNLAAENYFYRLQELIPEDVEFLRRFIEDSLTALRSSHEQLIEAFAQPYLAKGEIEG